MQCFSLPFKWKLAVQWRHLAGSNATCHSCGLLVESYASYRIQGQYILMINIIKSHIAHYHVIKYRFTQASKV